MDRPGTSCLIQDGPRPCRTQAVFGFIEEYLKNRINAFNYSASAGAGMDWHPYSPDLIPCKNVLFGTVKGTIFRNILLTLDSIKELIFEACSSVSAIHYRGRMKISIFLYVIFVLQMIFWLYCDEIATTFNKEQIETDF